MKRACHGCLYKMIWHGNISFNVAKICMQCVSMIQEYVSHLLVVSRIHSKRKYLLSFYKLYKLFISRCTLNVIQNYKNNVNICIKLLKGKWIVFSCRIRWLLNITSCFRGLINYFNLTVYNYNLDYRAKKSVSIQWQGRV